MKLIRKPPENFKPEDLPYFERHFNAEMEPPVITQYGAGRYFSNGQAIFSRLGVIHPPSVTYPAELPLFTRRYYWARRFVQKTVKVDGPLVVIADRHSRNYYHWHAEALANIAGFMESPLSQRPFTVIVPKPCSVMPYVQQSLPLFTQARILHAEENTAYYSSNIIHCKKLMPYGNQDPALIQSVIGVFNRALAPQPFAGNGRKIFLRRSGNAAKRRGITNENEVVALLTTFGFECLEFDTLDYLEQIKICRETSLLISMHGAGLTNMLFLPAGARVMELRPKKDLGFFYLLAQSCGHQYYYLSCERDQPTPGHEVIKDHTGHIRVNIEQLHAELKTHRLY